ncbi:MAG: response regulator [Alphaproteobacteria bacterium]|nr:response regulator [Alphaproteobacteria bacterium]
MNAPKRSALRVVILDPDPAKHQAEMVRSVLTMLQVSMIRDASDAGRLFARLQQFQADLLIATVSAAEAVVLATAVRRDTASPNRRLPIIAVVPPMTPAELVHVRDAGVTEILVHPITAKALAARVDAVIDRGRNFVDSTVFVGPDRRRRAGAGYTGPNRRKR